MVISCPGFCYPLNYVDNSDFVFFFEVPQILLALIDPAKRKRSIKSVGLVLLSLLTFLLTVEELISLISSGASPDSAKLYNT